MDRFFRACHTIDASHLSRDEKTWQEFLDVVKTDEPLQALVFENYPLKNKQVRALVKAIRARNKCVEALTFSNQPAKMCALVFEKALQLQVPRLCLRKNPAGVSAMSYFGFQLQEKSHLTHLDLGGNRITGNLLSKLIQGLQAQKKLQWLCLDDNPLGEVGLSYLPHLLKQPFKLRRLYLARTNTNDLAATHLAGYLHGHASMEVLDLSNNPHLGETGWYALSHAVRQNASLRVLDLAFTNPKGVNLSQMASALAENTTLQVLDYTFYDKSIDGVLDMEEVISNYLARNQRAAAH